jgi:hypothetical protein
VGKKAVNGEFGGFYKSNPTLIGVGAIPPETARNLSEREIPTDVACGIISNYLKS